MFTLITLATGRSLHMDFGVNPAPQHPGAELWGVPPDASPEMLFDLLSDTLEEPERIAQVVQTLGSGFAHALPSLEPLDELESDSIRSGISRALIDQSQSSAEEAVVELRTALEAEDGAAVVNSLLPSERWQLLAGFWLCRPQELVWAAYTPRNKDEVRVRARALLGIEGHVGSAAEGVPFLLDEAISLDARRRLVEAMGCSKVAEAVPELIPLLSHSDVAMQKAAITALGRIGRSAALDPMLSCWDLQDGALRGTIRAALRGLSSLPGHDYLRGFVETNSLVMVDSAVFVDDRLSLTHQLPKDGLLPLLSSSVFMARRDAAILLAVFGDETDAPRLRHLASQEPDEQLRIIAEQGANKLARSGRKKPVHLPVAGD